ncbi:hypothetical protein [Enterococcus gallinarum]|jgi:hypothetical protein|uniref:hypothetical protein n=1 Tax=Enterococcus gallinarum TaxID=1353 RepID=UPI001AD7C8E1|nr:hypothetical protein [Enterococcus gallinarum]MBO6420062.1 hypothetical protein [Enterococcus gallinarum]MBO6423059.1 hypothetical protein [Enterococcus gallinarum]
MEKEDLEQASLEKEKWKKKNYWVKESTIDRIRYWNEVRHDKNEGYTLEAMLDFYEKNHSQEQQAMEELLTLQRQQMAILREAEKNSKVNQQLLNTMIWFHEIEGFQPTDSVPLIEAKKYLHELQESQIKTAHHRKKYNQVGDE